MSALIASATSFALARSEPSASDCRVLRAEYDVFLVQLLSAEGEVRHEVRVAHVDGTWIHVGSSQPAYNDILSLFSAIHDLPSSSALLMAAALAEQNDREDYDEGFDEYAEYYAEY